jgi:hypothetical protein
MLDAISDQGALSFIVTKIAVSSITLVARSNGDRLRAFVPPDARAATAPPTALNVPLAYIT